MKNGRLTGPLCLMSLRLDGGIDRAMLEIGSVVDGRYRILREIDRGGMSVVYLVLNERLGKTWAMKAVRKEGVNGSDTQYTALLSEIHILKALKHPCLPSIVDLIDDGDRLLIIMDYIEGRSLKVLMTECMSRGYWTLPLADVLSWGRQLCDVLHYLHTRTEPVIYGDLKPSNVIVRENGEISLIDFGTARICGRRQGCDEVRLGTPGYAAPEQYGGDGRTGPWTDIYCLGATLHYLMTGRDPAPTPFYFPKITECRPQLQTGSLGKQREVLLGLERIIEKCTQYEADKRYTSCAALMNDLMHPERMGTKRLRFRIKRRYLIGCAVMLSAGLILALTVSAVKRHVQDREYENYMERAATAEPAERMEWYRKAVALSPWKADAYLEMLDKMLEDNCFSAEEEAAVTGLLASRDGGRRQDNRTFFRENKSGYVLFSYRMGMAYYYLAEGKGDKSRASGWFQNVADADMAQLDFGEDNIYKDAWQARARILGRIGSYYQYRLGQSGQTGDLSVTYGDYWEDLMDLMDEEVAAADSRITELRLYYEIVIQIYDRTMTFKNEAGLEQTELEGVLDEIEARIDRMSASELLSADDLAADIHQVIGNARKNIQAAYSSGE